jgi:amidase
MAQNYQEIASIARQRRDTLLASYYDLWPIEEETLPNDLTTFSFRSRLYTTEEVEILQSEAEDILQKIRDRIWTSLEVTEAFMKAAAIAQHLVG